MFVKPKIEEIRFLEEKKRGKTASKATKTNLRRSNLKMTFVNKNGFKAGLRGLLFARCKDDDTKLSLIVKNQ